MVFGDLTKFDCQHYLDYWINDKISIMGYIGDFVPYYCAFVIIYIYWVFGNKKDVSEISETDDNTSSYVSATTKTVSSNDK